MISFCWNALLMSPAEGKPVTAWYGQVHHLEREPDPGVVRRAAAVTAEKDLRHLGDVGRLLQSGRRIPARIGDGPSGRAADRQVVLGHVDLERGIVDQRRGRADREEPSGQAVGPGSDIQPQQVHGVQAAGAGRVLDDDGRRARDMFRQVARQDSRLGVDVAADPVVDDQGERLALVELGRRRRDRRDRGECPKGGGDSGAPRHDARLR